LASGVRASPVPPRETLAIGAETVSPCSAGVQGIPVSVKSLAAESSRCPSVARRRDDALALAASETFRGGNWCQSSAQETGYVPVVTMQLITDG
jgi:hypothetical protein